MKTGRKRSMRGGIERLWCHESLGKLPTPSHRHIQTYMTRVQAPRQDRHGIGHPGLLERSEQE